MATLRIALVTMLLCAGGPAHANWSVYLAGGIGISRADTTTAGVSNLIFPPAYPGYGGDFTDTSAMLGGSVGLQIPLYETTPWELPYDLRLPAWPVRLEAEANGLRNYKGRTDGPGNFLLFGETSSWNFMVNVWQDIALDSLNRPLAALFGRVPRSVKTSLQRTSLYGGAGIGVVSIDYDFTDNNAHQVAGQAYNLAWQVGGGIGFAISRPVSLDLGYRYLDSDKVEAPTFNPATLQLTGPFQFSQTAHEFRMLIRVLVFDFTQPYRYLPGGD